MTGACNQDVGAAGDTGLEVIDLADDCAFANRRLHTRDVTTQMEGMNRLAHAFVDQPEEILQGLVNAAVDLCGADSAGISLEKEERSDEDYYQWIATCGQYAPFLDAVLPRWPSACSICLERNRPQLFRVSQRFFDLMGVEAPIVTDGLLLPWQVEETRGTIWIMAHRRNEAFDREDLHLMQMLANFAAMGVHQQRQHKMMLAQASAAAAAAMANELAHQINNPLQSLTNLLYLARDEQFAGTSRSLAAELTDHVQRLSTLAAKLLAIPTAAHPPQ